MIKGIGIDHVQIARLSELLARHRERAASRLFTPLERRTCDGRARPEECYAARFAAKEALLKALGTGLSGGISWQDVEIRTTDGGRPAFDLSETVRERLVSLGADRVHLTFTHDGGCAAAIVVLEGPDQEGS